MEKIVITGGLGNIGSKLAHKLVDNSYDVIIYDYKNDVNSVKDILDNIRIIHDDVRNFENLRKVMIGATGVIHLAAISRVIWGYENPHECVDINIRGTSNVLETARISVKKPWVIFGSSREVYGEPDILPCEESAPKKIANIYGVTKISGENLLEQYHHNYDLSGLSLRFSNAYGSKYDQLDRVVPKFMIRAAKHLPLVIQGGKQILDFTHIDDTVDGILKGIKLLIAKAVEEKNIYDDFHILTGKPTSLQDLAKYIDKLSPNSVKVEYNSERKYDVEKFYGDPSKSKEKLEFESKIDLKNGLKMLKKELGDYLD